MAATATPGSRGALLLIFSLLSLVHIAASLIDQDHLEILEAYFEKGINEAAKKKALHEYICIGATNLFQEKLQDLGPTLDQLKVGLNKFPRLQGLTTIIDSFLEEKKEEFVQEIAARQRELRDIWDFIQLRETDVEVDDV